MGGNLWLRALNLDGRPHVCLTYVPALTVAVTVVLVVEDDTVSLLRLA